MRANSSDPRHSLLALPRLDLHARARAAGWHLLVCLVVASLAAALVFGVWYPGDYRALSGGRELFLLVTSVDVVLGPLLTFAIFDQRKGWPHLRRDLAVIGVIQLAGLAYGMHTVYVARPVAMVFEVDRFRVVAANGVYEVELPDALPAYRSLPLTGPWLLYARPAEAGQERNEALFKALEGIDTGVRPRFWRPYDDGRAEALKRARPVSVLLERHPEHKPAILGKLQEAGLDAQRARFVPVIARGDWVAFVDERGTPVAFIAVNGFF
jgi:hypothetical protein